MRDLLFKVLLSSVFLLLITLYIYIIVNKHIDTFDGITTPTPTLAQQTMNTILQEQIAIKLNVFPKRITINSYIDNGPSTSSSNNKILNVSFNVNDSLTSYREINPQSTKSIIDKAQFLFNNNTFIININNTNVLLKQIISTDNGNYKLNGNSSNKIPNVDIYFNNKGLHAISDYANDKYINVDNARELTRFYELKYDKNFKLNPVLV